MKNSMKKIVMVLMAGLVFKAVLVYAGNGDLIVNGSLGVGTTSTSSPFTVQSGSLTTFTNGSFGTVLVQGGAYSNGIWSGLIDFKTSNYSVPFARIGMYATNNGASLGFGTSNNYATGITNQAMTIDPNGLIGIGTANPSSRLDLQNGYITARDLPSDAPAYMQGTSGVAYFGALGNSTIALGNSSNWSKLVILDNGNVGIGTNPGYTLDVAGSSHTTLNTWSGSDIKLKKNLLPVTGALSIVLQLAGFSYEWKTDIYNEVNSPEISRLDSKKSMIKALEEKNGKIPTGKHYGVIAQDIEKILPEIVNTGSDGVKSVAYNEIIPFLIEAIKEQQQQIDELKRQHSQAK